MDRRRFSHLAAAATLVGGASPVKAAPGAVLTEDNIAAAWLATLPLIEASAARARMTDPERAAKDGRGSTRFVHARVLVNARFRAITTPNNDTLYSQAFVDLTQGPVTLTIPDVGARYQSVAIMDMYTNNNAVLGRRTPGGAAGTWTLIGPGMSAPVGAKVVKVATPHAWLLARTLVDGQGDLDAAHKAQDGLGLSGPAAAYTPATGLRTATWSEYFRSR